MMYASNNFGSYNLSHASQSFLISSVWPKCPCVSNRTCKKRLLWFTGERDSNVWKQMCTTFVISESTQIQIYHSQFIIIYFSKMFLLRRTLWFICINIACPELCASILISGGTKDIFAVSVIGVYNAWTSLRTAFVISAVGICPAFGAVKLQNWTDSVARREAPNTACKPVVK